MTEFIDDESSNSDWSSSSSSSDSASLKSFLRDELTYNTNMSDHDSYLHYYRERMALKRKKKSNRFFFKPRKHEPFMYPVKKDGTPAPGARTLNPPRSQRLKTSSSAKARKENDSSSKTSKGKPMEGKKPGANQATQATQTPVAKCKQSSASVDLPQAGQHMSPVYKSSIKRKSNVDGSRSRKVSFEKGHGCDECNNLVCECK